MVHLCGACHHISLCGVRDRTLLLTNRWSTRWEPTEPLGLASPPPASRVRQWDPNNRSCGTPESMRVLKSVRHGTGGGLLSSGPGIMPGPIFFPGPRSWPDARAIPKYSRNSLYPNDLQLIVQTSICVDHSRSTCPTTCAKDSGKILSPCESIACIQPARFPSFFRLTCLMNSVTFALMVAASSHSESRSIQVISYRVDVVCQGKKFMSHYSDNSPPDTLSLNPGLTDSDR